MDPGRARSGLARLMSRIRWRISTGTLGLPLRRRDFHRQNERKPARCQRITVSGSIHNARRNPKEAGKNQTIEIAEGEPLRNSRKNMSGSQFRERALCLTLRQQHIFQ
jgi:hypothetical protein